MTGYYAHPTAEIESGARIGPGCKIWHHAQVRRGARLGRGCIVGKDVYIDADVIVGDNCKIQNGVYLYHGVTVEDGVFLGPRATTTNDHKPRAIRPDGSPKGADDWVVGKTRICQGAAIGAGAILVCGITVGRFATVGAGSVVTHDVPPLGLVMGNPARLRGAVCPCGARLQRLLDDGLSAACDACALCPELTHEVAATLV